MKKVLMVIAVLGLIFSSGIEFEVSAGDEYLEIPVATCPIPPM